MIYFQIKNIKTGAIIAENIKEFSRHFYFENQKNITISKDKIRSGFKIIDSVSVWIIVIDEPDLANSSKRFNILFSVFAKASTALLPYYVEKIKAHSHTLRTIQGQMKQKMEGFAEPKDFRGESYSEQKNNIKLKVISNSDLASDLVCYLNKRIFEIESHIEIFDLLYRDDTGDSKSVATDLLIKEVNIKKVLLNIIAPFTQDFEAIGVHFFFHGQDDFFEEHKISINYKMFNIALYNFLDNAVKYVKPYTNIDLFFSSSDGVFEIRIEMMSCRVEKDECEKIFESGYSGVHANARGDGIGMFVMRESLNKIDMMISLDPEYAISENHNDIQYIRNVFRIKKQLL